MDPYFVYEKWLHRNHLMETNKYQHGIENIQFCNHNQNEFCHENSFNENNWLFSMKTKKSANNNNDNNKTALQIKIKFFFFSMNCRNDCEKRIVVRLCSSEKPIEIVDLVDEAKKDFIVIFFCSPAECNFHKFESYKTGSECDHRWRSCKPKKLQTLVGTSTICCCQTKFTGMAMTESINWFTTIRLVLSSSIFTYIYLFSFSLCWK